MSKNCMPLWREARFQVKTLKNSRCRSTFWHSDVQNCTGQNCTGLWREAHCQVKMHKIVRFGLLFEVPMSKKMCTPLWRQARFQVKVSEHFLKFRCRKIARRCGDKRVFKSKSRSIFWSSDVEKIARRCGEKHVGKSKCSKYLCFGTLFEVQMSK